MINVYLRKLINVWKENRKARGKSFAATFYVKFSKAKSGKFFQISCKSAKGESSRKNLANDMNHIVQKFNQWGEANLKINQNQRNITNNYFYSSKNQTSNRKLPDFDENYQRKQWYVELLISGLIKFLILSEAEIFRMDRTSNYKFRAIQGNYKLQKINVKSDFELQEEQLCKEKVRDTYFLNKRNSSGRISKRNRLIRSLISPDPPERLRIGRLKATEIKAREFHENSSLSDDGKRLELRRFRGIRPPAEPHRQRVLPRARGKGVKRVLRTSTRQRTCCHANDGKYRVKFFSEKPSRCTGGCVSENLRQHSLTKIRWKTNKLLIDGSSFWDIQPSVEFYCTCVNETLDSNLIYPVTRTEEHTGVNGLLLHGTSRRGAAVGRLNGSNIGSGLIWQQIKRGLALCDSNFRGK
ncbi:hypothetical protein WN51_12614 [Melipona quadrifasciata]|uniref:Uncharacterized protein n=1 Tax=Melipona quadrifasciata TaxID=166423 RepID=A0A0M9A3Q2_9HYME|nr:hypothetical protein WN51_12614 [Melipona quadrifasciata]